MRAASPLSAHALDRVAVAALLLALPGLALAPTMFFACWLAAWWFWTGLTLGALATCWIHALTGGRWGDAIRLVALPLARRLPWLLLAFLPLAADAGHVFPWASSARAWTASIERPAFEIAWYAPVFVWTRLAVIGVVWCALAQPAVFARKGRVAAALMLYTVTGSLVAFDLVMALVPGWYSTGQGLVELAGGALGGSALAVAIVARMAPHRFPTPPAVPAQRRPPPVWRDLGNLLLMWTMLWAYLAFVEFLIVWAENLPREIAWFLPRLETGWWGIGLALVVLQFALPFACLLVRANKDDPRRLARIATGLVAGQLLNCAWLVLPSVMPRGALGWWLLPLLAVAMGLPLVSRVMRDVGGMHRHDAEGHAEIVHA
ncbi:MAG TPA: hypothetical protein VH328_04325 [Burkholderiaceae bacterium]|nr:hypothetical protein [Burkholderiaceae bacterium]